MTQSLKPIILITILLIIKTNQQSVLDGLINIVEEGEEQSILEPTDTPNLLPEYDFIIIGAGTAGCVLANRLSENPNWNILLVEAGRPENYLMDVPILANYLQFIETNWKYKTEPSNNYCMGMDGQQCNWPRGKVMGGSSVLNYMIYTRGNRKDFDNWSKLGNYGWSYNDILPYYKKIENFLIDEHKNSTLYHNNNGYLGVSYAPYKTKIADAIINASQEFGFKQIDYNGKSQIGVSRLQVTMKNGVRESASRAYLHPIKNRSNLHVKKYAMVTNIEINPNTKQAYAIKFVRDNNKYTVKARKEILLSAGAINSPQLLMLSGIGPKKHLKQLNITVLSNLKVGYNLQDHIAVGGLTFLIDKPYSLRTEKIISAHNLKEYLNYHKGPLSVPGGCEVLVFQDFLKPFQEDGYPDIELLFQGGSIVSDPLLRKDFGITDQLYDIVYKPIEKYDSFMVFPMLMRPKSRGRIMLKTANWRTKPLIYPNYFQFDDDMTTIIKGVNLLLNITKQPSLQAIGAKLHNIKIPQCKMYDLPSDDYFKCMARHFTFTIYHQSGTCKMGPETDKKAVVNPQLKVYGINGLRVIDASIIPVIPAAHTNAPTFMIAEKAADMIKQDWNFPI